MKYNIEGLEVEEKDGEMILNMGPHHPSTHGVCRLVLKLEGERAKEIIPVIGYLHRGVEKICENRTYPQIIPITDRMDYLSAMNNNLVYCLAVEELMGIEVPERANYLRIIAAELQRIASHLIFIATFGADFGSWTIMMYGFREREMVLDLLEEMSGARFLYSYMRIGGVKRDVSEKFVEQCKKTLNIIEKRLVDYENYINENEILLDRLKGVAKVGAKEAINLGLTGPNLRASGVAYDIRKVDPYCIYDRFDFDIVTRKEGDIYARVMVRVDEIKESIRIVRQALRELPEGEIRAKVPKVIKPPAGEVYARVESPRGELAVYLISDGKSDKPYRIKFRTPAFANLAAFPHFNKNLLIPDLLLSFASIDIVMGDIDR